MKTVKQLIVCALFVLIAVPTSAQEPAAKVPEPLPPSLTSGEQSDFNNARAFSALASAKIMETREWKDYAKARAEAEERLKKVQALLDSTPEGKTSKSLRDKVNTDLRARGLVINWQTGAIAKAPPAQAKR